MKTLSDFQEWLEFEFSSEELKRIAFVGPLHAFSSANYYTTRLSPKEIEILIDQYSHVIWAALLKDMETAAESSPVRILGKQPYSKEVKDAASFNILLVWYLIDRTATIRAGKKWAALIKKL